MSEPLKAPRGTRDLLPSETALWRRAEAAFSEVFRRYGYGEIRTPIFEATELFARGIGEVTDIVSKEMYSFTDRKGRSLTLRPEGTAGVVRAYGEHRLGQGEAGEAKLCYFGPMFRYERPQAGRYRQFWQAGAEAIGFSSPLADAECIAMLFEALSLCGLKGLSVDLNSIGCGECRPAYLALLVAHLKSHEAGLSAESKDRLVRNPLRVMDSKDPQDAEAVSSAPKSTNHLCSLCSAHLAGLLRWLEKAGVPHQVNKKLVRGFDYYTRTVFEVLSSQLGAQSAICGGGRYDKLVGELTGEDRPAVGFGVGLDRLVSLMSPDGAPEYEAAVVVLGAGCAGPAFGLAQALRAAGVSCWMDLSQKKGMKAQMKAASQAGARFALILGPDELAKGEVAVKDMKDSSQAPLALDKAAAEIARRIKG